MIQNTSKYARFCTSLFSEQFEPKGSPNKKEKSDSKINGEQFWEFTVYIF